MNPLDAFGNELEIGDQVVYTHRLSKASSRLRKAEVVSFSPKKVTLKVLQTVRTREDRYFASSYRTNTSVYAHNIAKL